jgi:hypothetical protein
MEKEFVPYELAVKLKALGFDEPCFAYYKDMKGEKVLLYDSMDFDGECNVPLYQQAFRWFREKHGLFTSIIVDQTTKPKFYYNISEYYEDETTWEWKDGWGNSSLYRTYEEAERDCLTKLIEITEKHEN